MPKKLDLKKQDLEEFYTAKKEPKIIEVPSQKYITILGKGDPNGKDFSDAVSTLYHVAYKVKFFSKKNGKDFTVMPLEGQWWAEDMGNFRNLSRDEWLWKAMILQPGFITESDFETAVEVVKKKKDLPSIDKIQFEEMEDGLSAQIMHVGPYSEEEPTIDKLHEFIRNQGKELSGLHREIYISDMRRVAPEKLKTIIRQPMR